MAGSEKGTRSHGIARNVQVRSDKGGTKSMRMIAIAAVLLAVTATPAMAQKDVQGVKAFLGSIYKNYGKGRPGSRLGQPERYFEPELARRIRADQAAADKADEISKMDADPFCDCQDFEGMSPIEFDQIIVDNHAPKADAEVAFSFGDTRVKISYALAWTSKVWRIHDIEYDDGRSLRNVYFPPAD